VDETLAIKKFDGLEGTLASWVVNPRIDCSKCSATLGAGDIIWRQA